MRGRTLSEKVGDLVESLSPEAAAPEIVHIVARSFVDTFAAAVAGSAEPASCTVLEHVVSRGRLGPATLWASGDRVCPEDAALANAFMGHVLGFDDVVPPAIGHPSVALLPALVALGEAEGATGGQISAAYTVGFELLVLLSQLSGLNPTVRGRDRAPFFAAICGAAACAHLLRLDAERTAAAVEIASAQAPGAASCAPGMVESLQLGVAAAVAVRSARLAAFGFDSPRGSFEAAIDRASTNGGSGQLELQSWGEGTLELLRSGILVKKYPCSWHTYPVTQAIITSLAEQPLRPSQVERVRVTVEAGGLSQATCRRPWRGIEGKSSMEYLVAASILDGTLQLNSFTDAAVQRPEAQSLLRKVEALEEEDGPGRWSGLVQVELRGGGQRFLRVETPSEALWPRLTDGELAEKLRECVSFSSSALDIDRFVTEMSGWQDRPIRTALESALGAEILEPRRKVVKKR